MLQLDIIIRDGLTAELIKTMTGEPMRRLLQTTGDAGVAQVRRNIVTEGKASGSFAPLSGYNQGAKVQAKERNRQRRIGILDGSAGRDKHTAKHGVSRHAGYARQKERDFEAGKLIAGPDQKLVATGDLERSLIAVVTMQTNLARVALHAVGEKSSGISNADLLALLAFGTADMPARNPALNMQQVEERFQANVDRLLRSHNVTLNEGGD